MGQKRSDHAPGGHYRCFNKLLLLCLKQIAVLIGGIALFVAHRSGAAAVPGVLLNLSRWLIITSTFTFVYALYKVMMMAACILVEAVGSTTEKLLR